MNLFYILYCFFPFLDVIYEPMTFNLGVTSPETKVIVIVVLLLFLVFTGYLIWNVLKKKD
ncbi:MAG: hypothetical protein J6A77_10830 [Lachnospiraceae bacterium]|nr:hypothetical protein [Lachnospiraceae bacterium]